MNYRKIYNSLIMKAWRRGDIDGYKEKHHIIPRCQGGGNDKANLVNLTAAEHYIAHLLLVRIYPVEYKLAIPVILMGKNLNKISNKIYASLRVKQSLWKKGTKASEETKKKISESGKGRVDSEETRMKKSLASKGRKFSTQHKEKLALAKIGKSPSNKGVKSTEEKLEKLRQAWTKRENRQPWNGKKHSEESKEKMRRTKARNKQRKEILTYWCAL